MSTSVLNLRIITTNRCNRNCHFCHQEGYSGPPALVSLEIIEALIFQLQTLDIKTRVCLTGGEPLLHPQITKIIEAFLAERLVEDLWLTTNGTLLNQWAEELARVNLPEIHVSIHSSHSDILRRITLGEEVDIDQIIKQVKFLITNGITAVLNYTLVPGLNDSTEHLHEMILLSREALIPLRIITPYQATKAYCQSRREVVLKLCNGQQLNETINDFRVTRFCGTEFYLEFISPCVPEEGFQHGAIFLTPVGTFKSFMGTTEYSMEQLTQLLSFNSTTF